VEALRTLDEAAAWMLAELPEESRRQRHDPDAVSYRPFFAACFPRSMSFLIVWPPLRPIFS
jgi:hypothetical protein